MGTVGASVPARRPFYRPPETMPILIRDDDALARPVYVYTLHGGWPTFNSVVRLAASSIAVISAFSFATIATVLSHHAARRIFSITLLTLMLFAFAAAMLDAVAIGSTAAECANRSCTSAVPDVVIQSPNKCTCFVGGWFYVTLLSDVVLAVAALICFILSSHPALAAAAANPVPYHDPNPDFVPDPIRE